MDIASKNDFIYWMQRAVEDQQNDCYIELYNILLRWNTSTFIPNRLETIFGNYTFRAFVTADVDFDGKVSFF